MRGRTGADGRVLLRNLFYAGGVSYPVGSIEHVTFSPFVIRVAVEGFTEFRASLTPPLSGVPDGMATDPPRNLSYPVSGPVTIPLTRSTGGSRRGRSEGTPEG